MGIASFRDSRCGQTLFNLFHKAKFPDRISVGVVQQNDEGDSGCLEDFCGIYGFEVWQSSSRHLIVRFEAELGHEGSRHCCFTPRTPRELSNRSSMGCSSLMVKHVQMRYVR